MKTHTIYGFHDVQVNDAECERLESEVEHKQAAQVLNEAEQLVKKLQRDWKRNIAKSRFDIFLPYAITNTVGLIVCVACKWIMLKFMISCNYKCYLLLYCNILYD